MDLSFFQIMMVLSFLLTLGTVIRLHRGIRILNARVTILSHLMREVRRVAREDEVEATDEAQAEGECELQKRERELGSEMGRDFAPGRQERGSIRKARELQPRVGTVRRRPTPAPTDHLPTGGLAQAREQVAELEAQLRRAQQQSEMLARHNLALQERERENSAVSALLDDIESNGQIAA